MTTKKKFIKQNEQKSPAERRKHEYMATFVVDGKQISYQAYVRVEVDRE
jgi:hypothetical protein